MTGPQQGRLEVGRPEVISGPVFYRKSEELIRRLKRARIARQSVACFKPDIDLRYHRSEVASVERLREALFPQLPKVEVIGIDEAGSSTTDHPPRPGTLPAACSGPDRESPRQPHHGTVWVGSIRRCGV